MSGVPELGNLTGRKPASESRYFACDKFIISVHVEESISLTLRSPFHFAGLFFLADFLEVT
jgi:hypothetical protein